MSRLPTIRPPGPISRLADAAFTCGRILRSGLYGDLGWRVVWTYARVKFLSMFDAETPGADPQQTQVAGWRVRYWGTRFLATLFGTKFVKLEYLFDTNAPRPRIIDCAAHVQGVGGERTGQQSRGGHAAQCRRGCDGRRGAVARAAGHPGLRAVEPRGRQRRSNGGRGGSRGSTLALHRCAGRFPQARRGRQRDGCPA